MNLGLYIHIPFCHRRCNYCDFYLTTNLSLIDQFVNALVREIELYSKEYSDYNIDTIFFGGGTPSILSPEMFDNIITSINTNFKVNSTPEITIECNPEDILADKNKFVDFKKIGANRISVGVQSFIDKELSFLTRLHNGNDALKSLETSMSIFDNVSADLIYSFKDQELSDIEFNLNKVIALNIQHVSAYTLILEKGTLLYKEFEKKNLLKFIDDNNPQSYEFVNNVLRNNGYIHYEISNYAKDGFQSKHNLKYWNFENYLGLGPSSHSFIGNKRFINVKSVTGYIKALSSCTLPVHSSENLADFQLRNDYFISVFRSMGVNFEKYKKLFASEFIDDFDVMIKQLVKLELAVIENSRFFLTEKGFALADEITLGFLK